MHDHSQSASKDMYDKRIKSYEHASVWAGVSELSNIEHGRKYPTEMSEWELNHVQRLTVLWGSSIGLVIHRVPY